MDVDAGVHQIFIPSIVLVEVVYLVEKKRVDHVALDQLFYLLDLAPTNYAVFPLDVEVVCTLRMVDRVKAQEMPDRIIVATAKHLGVELITKDITITAVGIVPVVW